jgi:DNA-binding response OmpR family regulator
MEDQLNDIILKSAKNYLKKPFEIDELENTIRQVLDDNQG